MRVCLSMRYNLNRLPFIWYNCWRHWDVCSGLDPVPYLKGQAYTRYLKVRVQMLMSALLLI